MRDVLLTAAPYSVVCGVLHLFAWFTFDRIWKNYRALPAAKRNEGHNRFVSLIHSSLIFALDLHYWQSNQIFTHDKNKVYSSMEKFMIDIMIGYLVYDLIFEMFKGFGEASPVDPPQDTRAKITASSGKASDLTKVKTNRKYKGAIEQVFIFLHHIAGLSSHISTRLSNNPMCYHYSMLVYLAESSTPTLNITWFLYEMKWDKNIFFSIIAYTTLLSFFVLRVLLSPYLVVHMVYYRADWGDGTFLLFYGNLLIMIIFAALNFVWFYKLVNLSRKLDNNAKQQKVE
jgi:hypothetical protein